MKQTINTCTCFQKVFELLQVWYLIEGRFLAFFPQQPKNSKQNIFNNEIS